jgi:predicted DNA-binding transcriptional regulator YafY
VDDVPENHAPAFGLPARPAAWLDDTRVEMNAVHQTIVDAIRTRRRLRFTYNGRPRLVEPQCYGVGTKGTRLLRAHQLLGGEQREPLFNVTRIEGLVLLDETFATPGPNYKKNDSAMVTILCQL